MKKILGLATLAAIGISLFPVIPAHAATTGTNDIVCRFRHRADNGEWMTASAGGTTRAGARNERSKVINRLESQATASGSELEVVHLGCNDPFGND